MQSPSLSSSNDSTSQIGRSVSLLLKGASFGPSFVRGSQVVVPVLILCLPFFQQLQPSHRVLETAPFQRQRPDDILLVHVAAAGIQELSGFETRLYVSGTVVVFLQEFVVVFREVGRGRKNRVEFGGDDFLNFAVRWFGLCAEGLSKTDSLFVGGLV